MVANKTANSSTIDGYKKFPKYRENKYGDSTECYVVLCR